MGALNASRVVSVQRQNLVLVAGGAVDAANFRVRAGLGGGAFQFPILSRIVVGAGGPGNLTVTLAAGNPGTVTLASDNALDNGTIMVALVEAVS